MINNEILIDEEQKNENIYLPIGYPLGYERGEIKHINDEPVYRLEEYLIEKNINSKLSTVTLTPNEFHIWSHIFVLQGKDMRHELFSENNTKLIKSLKDKDVLIQATTTELLEKILKLKPIRQGASLIRENKRCIGLGMYFFYPSLSQCNFWTCSNGENSINTIFNILSETTKKSNEIFTNDFILDVFELIKNGVLFLR